mmetsp:Transcript_17085/g.25270  ORF Transcript_17085/g.25270 Transcript_17085/m.25270 type:complete len:88 (+) Transcript_17085:37-300(+)
MAEENYIDLESDIINVKNVNPSKKFSTTNQARYCWNLYNEWMLCMKKNDLDEEKCMTPRFVADTFCPDEWYQKWDEDREEEKFTGLK